VKEELPGGAGRDAHPAAIMTTRMFGTRLRRFKRIYAEYRQIGFTRWTAAWTAWRVTRYF
jgi:hypothetical protein